MAAAKYGHLGTLAGVRAEARDLAERRGAAAIRRWRPRDLARRAVRGRPVVEGVRLAAPCWTMSMPLALSMIERPSSASLS